MQKDSAIDKQHHEPALTALERELLTYVERLTKASENSATQFTALEQRSTGQMNNRIAALEDCASLLIASQQVLIEALSGSNLTSKNTGADFAKVRQILQTRILDLKQATKDLNPPAPK